MGNIVDIGELLKQVGLAGHATDSVKLNRGVVGRTSIAICIFLIVAGIVASRIDPSLLLWVLAITAAVFAVYFGGVIWFANKNPAAALLEGAEFVQYRQIEVATKTLGSIPSGEIVVPTAGLGASAEPKRIEGSEQ